MMNNPIRLNDIFTITGKLTLEVNELAWPDIAWVLEQWSDLENTWFLDWVTWSFPSTIPEYTTMRTIVKKVYDTVSTYRYNSRVQKSLRISDVIRQWNECVAAEYNITLSLLGYTENQYLYINETAAIVKSLIFSKK